MDLIRLRLELNQRIIEAVDEALRTPNWLSQEPDSAVWVCSHAYLPEELDRVIVDRTMLFEHNGPRVVCNKCDYFNQLSREGLIE